MNFFNRQIQTYFKLKFNKLIFYNHNNYNFTYFIKKIEYNKVIKII